MKEIAMTERAPDPLKACWLNQPTEDIPMTIADIHTRIGRFQARKRCEAAFVLPGAAAMAVFFGWMTWTATSNLARLSGVVDLAWALAVAFFVYWRWLRIRPPEATFLAGVEFHRRQLTAEQRERRTLWLWCFLPLIIAYGLLVAGARHPWAPKTLLADAVVLAGFISGSLVARAKDRSLQRQIDALDSL
jgi:hypothetical protein